MDCLACRTTNEPGLQFCTECGAPLPVACGSCGFANRGNAKFCGRCGAPVKAGQPDDRPRRPPAGGDRRQVAVLFADLCGFTRLSSELDAEEVHGLLGHFFETVDAAVETSGGRIDKHIGDAVMAIFGAPVAHGNDIERALHAAFAIHRAAAELGEAAGRPLAVHVGVAGGEVVASGTGSSRHQEYTVTGEAVNLAARLNDLAAPGETLVSDAIQGAVARKFDCEAMGEKRLEGFAGPVRVWRALGPSAPRRATAPLVGRKSELRQFAGILEACRESGAGQAIHLRGEAGIGKTRLAEEFVALARAAGFACHKALVLDFGMADGEDTIRSLVLSLLALSAEPDPQAREQAVDRLARDGLTDQAALASFNDLLGLPQPTGLRAMLDAMDAATRTRQRQSLVARLVGDIAARTPLFLVIEDIHWAEPLTLQYLMEIGRCLADRRAILLLTSRIEGDPLDPAWRAAARDVPLLTLDLAPLRLEEAAALAARFSDVVDDLAHKCIERAAGNPLFLEQLLRGAEDYAAGAVPASIQSLVLARMDQLSPRDRRALQVASILGQRFSLATLRAMLEDPGYEPDGLLRAFLVRPAGGDYLFAHALIRDAAYASLLRSTLRELHRRAADWFAERDATLTAEHLDRAEDPGAGAAYLKAARGQVAAYRFERALDLARRGAQLDVTPSDAFELVLIQAELLVDIGSVRDAAAAYRDAIERAPDDAARCRALLGLASTLRVSDQYREALTELDAAEAIAAGARLPRELSAIRHLRGNLHFSLGNVADCLEEHGRALDHARQAGWLEGEARALGGLGDGYYLRGRMATAHDHFRRCVDLCRLHGFGRVEVANRHMIGWSVLYLAPLPDAEREGLAATEMAARVSHRRAEMLGRHLVVFARIERGDIAAAKPEVALARALARRLGARNFEAQSTIQSARIAALEGRHGEALDEAEQALAISRSTSLAFLGPMILGTIARLTGDPAVRRKVLAEGEAVLDAGAVGHNHYWFYRDAIDVALTERDWASAERYASALEAYCAAEPLVWARLVVDRGRALAAIGDGRGDGMATEVARLRGEAERLGWRLLIPALDEAAMRLDVPGEGQGRRRGTAAPEGRL